MRVLNKTEYPTEEVRELLRFAAKGIRTGGIGGITVTVKNGKHLSGLTNRSPYSSGPRYSITLRLPQQYPRPWWTRTKGEWVETYRVQDWREGLILLAGHEFYHVRQYRKNAARKRKLLLQGIQARERNHSHVRSDRWGSKKLEQYRRQKGEETSAR